MFYFKMREFVPSFFWMRYLFKHGDLDCFIENEKLLLS